MLQPKKASLLGIPPELRMLIYSYVRITPVSAKAIDGFHSVRTRAYGSRAVPHRCSPFSLQLPWQALKQTCRTIADEMQMRSSASPSPDEPAQVGEGQSSADGRTSFPSLVSGVPEERTYILDVELVKPDLHEVGAVTWIQVPCAPQEARMLDIRCYVQRHDLLIRFGGDGGPREIVSHLYQSLNLILHCGPRMDSSRLLEGGFLRVKGLSIDLRPWSETDVPHLEWGNLDTGEFVSSPALSLQLLGQLMRRLALTGLLGPYVERMKVSGRGGKDGELDISPNKGGGGVPQIWEGYGFEWGPESFQVT